MTSPVWASESDGIAIAEAGAADIAGVHVLSSEQFGEAGRRMSICYEAESLQAVLGKKFEVARANTTASAVGVLRGIKYVPDSDGPAKAVACVSGRTLDVVVDLREGSPTFGKWKATVLTAEGPATMVVIPPGVGHATLALDDDSVMVYLLERSWHPDIEQRIDPCDTAIGITWPSGIQLRLSDAETQALSLVEAQHRGLLPEFRRG